MFGGRFSVKFGLGLEHNWATFLVKVTGGGGSRLINYNFRHNHILLFYRFGFIQSQAKLVQCSDL